MNKLVKIGCSSMIGLCAMLGINHNSHSHAIDKKDALGSVEKKGDVTSNTLTGLNIRQDASALSKKLGRLEGDSVVSVKEVRDGWTKVVTKGGVEGWVSGYYVSGDLKKGQPKPSYIKKDTRYVNTSNNINDKHITNAYIKKVSSSGGDNSESYSNIKIVKKPVESVKKVETINKNGSLISVDSLNLRSDATTKSSINGVIKSSDNFKVLEKEDNGWVKVRTDDGREGYIYSSYVKLGDKTKVSVSNDSKIETMADTSEAKVNKSYRSVISDKVNKFSNTIVNTAKSYLGTRYVWGGTTPNGFDCSGFTQYVYNKALGISIPRVSYMQATAGTHIDANNVEVGDLLYFDTVGGGRTSHVGIYLGDGRFIHAAGSQTNPNHVMISSLKENWAKCLGARRFV